MSGSTACPRRGIPRHLILGTAFLLAFAVSLAPKSPHANAQDAKAPASVPAQVATPAAPASPSPPAKAALEIGKHGIEINIGTRPGELDAKPAADADNAPPDPPGTITIKKNGKTVRVTGLPEDRDIDSSVEHFMSKEPPAGVILAIVAVVFLSPVLAIALILGYRTRKNRLLNETMLKLVEKGLVPAADALEAVSAGRAPPTGSAAAARSMGGMAVLAAQGDLRKRAAWSDLRKGVIMGSIGLGITLHSFFDDRSANFLGLVLLFVGIGYTALWWFEERQLASLDHAGPQSGPGVPGPGNTGPGPGA